MKYKGEMILTLQQDMVLHTEPIIMKPNIGVSVHQYITLIVEEPEILKSIRDQEQYTQFMNKTGGATAAQKAATASVSSLSSNPFLVNVPTVGYMGHKPVYRKPITAIGPQNDQHFDLATTKSVYSPSQDAAKTGAAQGFIESVKKEV
jgi:hypothetical protein